MDTKNRRKAFAAAAGLALVALGVRPQPASARRAYCGKFLYYCPKKQNVVCGQGNHADCFRKGLRRGDAQRI